MNALIDPIFSAIHADFVVRSFSASDFKQVPETLAADRDDFLWRMKSENIYPALVTSDSAGNDIVSTALSKIEDKILREKKSK